MGRKAAVVSLASPDEIEQRFYEALQHADIERLMAVWADDDEIACIHPGGPRLLGPQAIRTSFESLFGQGPIEIEPRQVHRLRTHSTAVHSVVERVRVSGDDGPQIAWALATNVYVRIGAAWRMVVHHASPGSDEPPPEIGESALVLH